MSHVLLKFQMFYTYMWKLSTSAQTFLNHSVRNERENLPRIGETRRHRRFRLRTADFDASLIPVRRRDLLRPTFRRWLEVEVAPANLGSELCAPNVESYNLHTLLPCPLRTFHLPPAEGQTPLNGVFHGRLLAPYVSCQTSRSFSYFLCCLVSIHCPSSSVLYTL